MASTQRFIDTRFWSDVWVRKLNALDRYVFLYFLTNQHSSWCGVYELDIAMAAFELGIDAHDLETAILPRLAPKICFVDGWVYIKNFEKYHTNGSKDTQTGIQKAWAAVPERIQLKIKEIEGKVGGPIGGGVGVSPLSSTFTSTLSSTPTVLGADAPTQELVVLESPAQEATVFFSGIQDLANGIEHPGLAQGLAALEQQLNIPKATLWREVQAFTLYWTERNRSGKKQRWELEKTFEVHRRFLTWLRRSSQTIRGPTKPVSKYKAGIV